MHVVVVESPAKAKTVLGLLGTGHTVIATRGHVKDLPAKDGSVDPARGFALLYATNRRATRTLRSIAAALREADALVLATDPDREGEAIAWQVLTWLEEHDALRGKPVRRVVFHEVTADAVRAAMDGSREIDMDLVHAQQARRALDYLVGFHLSPVLWRKVRGGRSAGRVQSVALRLVCAREEEIEDFVPQEYWTVEADVMAERGGSFTAQLSGLDGEALGRHALGTGKSAEAAARRVHEGVFRVATLEPGIVRRNPVPPFTTSTLQQEARGLKRDDIRNALESTLERYLFASAGQPVERACPSCADGRLMLKLGRFGPFVGCANFPDCSYRRPLSGDPAEGEESRKPVVLGTDGETGLVITLRSGRYGRYIQRGEDDGDVQVLRRTIPAAMEAEEITPEVARALLALPRTVGVHPHTGKTILAGVGRYGAWLKHGATYVPLADGEDVLTVGLNHAVALVDARIR